jgi:rod shape-determining protein MreC
VFKPSKNLTLTFVVAGFALVCSLTVSYLKPIALDISHLPLSLFNFLADETKAAIFYHRNYKNNIKLEEENGLLKQMLNKIDEIDAENSRLRELLSLKDQSSFKVRVAGVIAHSPDNWSASLIINKGKASGINKGMTVLSYKGLLGRVVETGNFTSKVLLISDPSLSISALVMRSRQEGLICGGLGNCLNMKYLPRDADIQVSDVIVTSGLTSGCPKGLMIGTVTYVGEEFSGLSKYAIVKPFSDLANTEEVMVVAQ